jgi:serine/threonine protein phosphatase PrpC
MVMLVSEAQRFRFDATAAIDKGGRETQEDAVICDFSRGEDFNFAVLSDGMGGHAAGDLASKIVVTEIFSELMFQRSDPKAFDEDCVERLTDAAMAANRCIKGHVASDPTTLGMGATLIASVICNNVLRWISIGDSPLYLFRAGRLKQLNEDHSMAPQIDLMAAAGMIDREEASTHPERNVLTSVLFGEDIPKIDCPEQAFNLEAGDIVILASDGLQFLDNIQIQNVLIDHPFSTSDELSEILLRKLKLLNDPELDNVSFFIIRVQIDVDKFAAVPQPPARNSEGGLWAKGSQDREHTPSAKRGYLSLASSRSGLFK